MMRKTVQLQLEVHRVLEKMLNDEVGKERAVKSTSDLIHYLCDFYNEHSTEENKLALQMVMIIKKKYTKERLMKCEMHKMRNE